MHSPSLLLGYFDLNQALNQGMPFVVMIAVVAIIFYTRMRRHQMWHETARLAIEKGQPVPGGGPEGLGFPLRRRARGRKLLTAGLVMAAIGIGFRLIDLRPTRLWAPLPLCIGVALLLAALISSRQAGDPADPQDPANRQ